MTQPPPRFSSSDRRFMLRALTLAKRGLGLVNPNPLVGAVITQDGHIIGDGWHQQYKQSHAEIMALKKCTHTIKKATLYVTLEPCCHTGHTPPCTAEILTHDFDRIVIAQLDPNPRMQGRGVALLRAHGIKVEVGCLEEEARKLNCSYNHYILHKTPYLISKWAMSLNGATTTHSTYNRDISCEQSQHHAHYWRQYCDAILVGVNTISYDNPALTSRYYKNTENNRSPLRIILDPSGRTPLDSQILKPNNRVKTLVICSPLVSDDFRRYINKNGHYSEIIGTSKSNEFNIDELFKTLDDYQVHSVLIEGGAITQDYFFKHKRIHQIEAYMSPLTIHSTHHDQWQLNKQHYVGRDFYAQYYLKG